MNSCGAKAVFQAALTKWKFTILLLQWIINKAWNEITNKYQLIINPACPKLFWGLVKMTLMLVTSHVHAGYSLHEGQATKLTFFAPWNSTTYISIIMTFNYYCIYKMWWQK